MGAVVATYGVNGLQALVNGPGGCRSRSLALIRQLLEEYKGDSDCCCRSEYMSRITILPCTFLNADDIILGSGTKIADALKNVISGLNSDVVLIDTLGATVQVVDREQSVKNSGYGDRVILTDEDLAGMSFQEGFDNTIMRILAHYVGEKGSTVKGAVNVLGYTIADRSWDYGKMEIESLLKLAGASSVRFIGCGSEMSDILGSAEAELNIVLRPETAIQTASWYRDVFGIPYLVPSEGAPIGFDSIRSFVREVSGKLGTDSAPAMEAVDAAEQRALRICQNYNKILGGMRGYSMAVRGQESDVYPMMKMMCDFLNVIPRSVQIIGGESGFYGQKIRDFLQSTGVPDALGAPFPKHALRFVFTDGLSADTIMNEDPDISAVGIFFPYKDTIPLSNHCLVGISGTYNLLEETVAGIRRFVCGQPTAADFM